MRDVMGCDTGLVAQLAKEVEDLMRCDDVERRRRFVEHDQSRVTDECRGDHQTLFLTAGRCTGASYPPDG